MSSLVRRSSETAPVVMVPPKEPPKKQLSPFVQCTIGALVGGGEPFVGTPLNNVKQALQNGAPIPRSIGALWSGTLLTSAYCASVTAPQFFVRGVLRKHFSEDGKKPLEAHHHLITAASSSLASSVIATPAEMVLANFAEKMRLYEEAKKQNKKVPPKPTYKSVSSEVDMRYGPAGYYRGWKGIVIRDTKFVYCYSTLAPQLAEMFTLHFPEQRAMANLTGGAIAGATGAVISHHWDTWKTRRALGEKTTFKQFIWQGHYGMGARVGRVALAVGLYTEGTDVLTDLFQKLNIT